MSDVADIVAVSAVVTARCNLGCAYCYQDRRPARGMSWDTLREAVNLLLRSRRTEVTIRFYGGEPLLRFPLLRQAIEYGRQTCPAGKRLRFGISTNGLLLNDERAAFLARHRVETQLSFDGVSEAQDRRRVGSFSALDGLLDYLRGRHPTFFAEDLTVHLTLTGASLGTLARSVGYFFDKGLRRLSVGARFTHDPDWKLESIDELDRQFSQILERSLELHRRTGRVPLSLLRTSEGSAPREKGAMCRVGRNGTLAIDVDGQTAGCLLFLGSYQGLEAPMLRERVPRLRLGSVTDPRFPQLLAAQPAALRKAGLFDGKEEKYSSYGRCRCCRYSRDCLACPMSIGYAPDSADPRRVSDLECAFNLVSLKYRDRFRRQTASADPLRQVLIPDLARRVVAAIPAAGGPATGRSPSTARPESA